ncbi:MULTISPECIES: hypothetical protein [unclassified Luteococcus]|uniref:hypothetical protein n=1 Tax=unclassified Luteococcus TaxID=2639923 RepID=UPI00313D497D
MADWTDGAEYAPVERPDAFATPRAAALGVEERPPSPAEGKPVQPPQTYQQPQVAPLEELTPRVSDPRDPTTPFNTVVAADSAWGAVHAGGGWNPRMPLGPTAPDPQAPDFPPPSGAPSQATPAFPSPQFPPPGASPAAPPATRELPLPGQFPPPSGQPAPLPPPPGRPAGLPQPGSAPQSPSAQPGMPPQPPLVQRPANPFDPAPRPGQAGNPGQQLDPRQWGPQPPSPRPTPSTLNAQTVLRETGPLALAVLAFGVLVPVLSYLMLVLGSILTRRLNAGGQLLRQLFSLALAVLLLTVLYDTVVHQAWPHVNTLGQFLCGLMIPVSLACVYQDLRKRMQR